MTAAADEKAGPSKPREPHEASAAKPESYSLDAQVGYLLRLASQRHAAIFQDHMIAGLTPTQFALLVRLGEVGEASQNRIGRLAAMDVATAKGVVDRLAAKGLVTFAPDREDGRRRVIALSAEGRALLDRAVTCAKAITEATLEPLNQNERTMLLSLLRRLG
ncbi:MAG: MarR family transcriptional regulator [Pseudomonadota bacterium]